MKRHRYLFAAVLAVLCLSLVGCGAKINAVAITPLRAMQPGETAKLDINYFFNDSTISEAERIEAESSLILIYASSDESIATVDTTGTVTAVSAGTANITISSTENALQASTTVTVKPPIESITLTPKTLALEIAQSEKLTVETLPIDTVAITALQWESNNEKVATVDKNGTVTAVSEGIAIVTVTIDNGKSVSGIVTVSSAGKSTADSETAASDDMAASKTPTVK